MSGTDNDSNKQHVKLGKNILKPNLKVQERKEIVEDSETAFLIPETSSFSVLNSEEDVEQNLDSAIERKNARISQKLRRNLVIGTSFVVVFLLLAIVIALMVKKNHEYDNARRRNVILMVSDGFGPASESFARTYLQHLDPSKAPAILPLDNILVGTSRTRSSSSLITDSAAGATAFSCLLKTYNAAIAVDPFHKPCGTVLEAAKALGMTTALVVTSRVTHATPAAFSSHVLHRNLENDIALQQIGNYSLGRNLDILFGGGRCEFLPKSNNTLIFDERGWVSSSCRNDEVDVLRLAESKFGWTVIDSREQLLKSRTSDLPILGLFATDHMSYEIDRDSTDEPSLLEMAKQALDLLRQKTKDSSKGYFIMIEGSRIDMAAHSNDPKAHFRDIMAYQETVQYVREFVAKHPDTVMISVSDHETGGLSLGKQNTESYPDYLWYPQVLDFQSNSTIRIASSFFLQRNSTNDCHLLATKQLAQYLNITDASDVELQYLCDATKTLDLIDYFLGDMISKRALIGWATHGHSGVDVNLYSTGVDSELLAGNHENVDIGKFIYTLLKLDLAPITAKLASMDLRNWSSAQISDAQRPFLSRRHLFNNVKEF